MTTKDTSITSRLLAVQQKLKAPKGQLNKFGGYHYRSAEDILQAAKPVCGEHDLLLMLSDTIEMIGDRYYVKATATIYDALKEESTITVTAFAREEENKKGMDASQITGGASSYARKYALNGLFAIDDTKDSDATNEHGSTSAPKVAHGTQNTKGTTTAKPAQKSTSKAAVKSDGDIKTYSNDLNGIKKLLTDTVARTGLPPQAIAENLQLHMGKQSADYQADDFVKAMMFLNGM